MGQKITLYIHVVPVGVEHLFQTVEHLVGDFLHLAQPFLIDKVLDVGVAQEKNAQEYRKAGKAGSKEEPFVFFGVQHPVSPVCSVQFHAVSARLRVVYPPKKALAASMPTTPLSTTSASAASRSLTPQMAT